MSKKVLLLYVGGTVGMKYDERDGSLHPVPMYFTNEIKNQNSNLLNQTDVIEFDPLLDSSDMGPNEWIQIAIKVWSFPSIFPLFYVDDNCQGDLGFKLPIVNAH